MNSYIYFYLFLIGGAFKAQYGSALEGDQLVEEFMTETQAAAAAAPQAFRMDSLLQVRGIYKDFVKFFAILILNFLFP